MGGTNVMGRGLYWALLLIYCKYDSRTEDVKQGYYDSYYYYDFVSQYIVFSKIYLWS